MRQRSLPPDSPVRILDHNTPLSRGRSNLSDFHLFPHGRLPGVLLHSTSQLSAEPVIVTNGLLDLIQTF